MIDLVNTVYESKNEVMHTVQKRANELNFAVSTKRSNRRSVYIQCVHGGVYRNTRNMQNGDRIRKKSTRKTGCEWLLAASLASKKKIWVIRSVSDNDAHNHPLVTSVFQRKNKCSQSASESAAHQPKNDVFRVEKDRETTNEIHEEKRTLNGNTENSSAKIKQGDDDQNPVNELGIVEHVEEKFYKKNCTVDQ